MLSRRKALVLGGGLATGTAPLLAVSWLSQNPEKLIRSNLKFLTIAPEALSSFAEALRESQNEKKNLLSRALSNPDLTTAIFRRLNIVEIHQRYVDVMCTKFLLSTDFFQTGSDPTRPMKFVQLADPYIDASYNRLAVINDEVHNR